MKLYVDDYRQVPTGWVAARTLVEALCSLSTGDVTHLSFGDIRISEPVLRWLAAHPTLMCELDVHCPNLLQREQIENYVQLVRQNLLVATSCELV